MQPASTPIRRVARAPAVILTTDATISTQMWLFAEYMPEAAELGRRTLPSIEQLVEWLGPGAGVETIALDRDTPDWMFEAFWAHAERVFDASARAGTSSFARMDRQIVNRVLDVPCRHLKRRQRFSGRCRDVDLTQHPHTPGEKTIPSG